MAVAEREASKDGTESENRRVRVTSSTTVNELFEEQHHAATLLKVPKQMSSTAGSMRSHRKLARNSMYSAESNHDEPYAHRDSTPSWSSTWCSSATFHNDSADVLLVF